MRQVRDTAAALARRGQTNRGACDGQLRACPTYPRAEMLGGLAESGRAGGLAEPRRGGPRPRRRRRELLCHRGGRTTNNRRALPRGRTRADGRPPDPRAGAGPAPGVGQAWRRPSPPSGRTFSRRNRAEQAAEGRGSPRHRRPHSLSFEQLCHDQLFVPKGRSTLLDLAAMAYVDHGLSQNGFSNGTSLHAHSVIPGIDVQRRAGDVLRIVGEQVRGRTADVVGVDVPA